MHVRHTISPQLLTQGLQGATVAIHLGTNQIYELSATAARLLDLFSQGRTAAAACEQLRAEYDVPEAVLWAELRETVRLFTECGFITPGAPDE
jgi:hypothetical protein